MSIENPTTMASQEGFTYQFEDSFGETFTLSFSGPADQYLVTLSETEEET